MSAFVIFLHEDEPETNAKLRGRIEDRYPGAGHYKVSEHVYLVTGQRLVSDVGETLGLSDEDELYAAILRLNDSFCGRSHTKLWGWLRAAFGVVA